MWQTIGGRQIFQSETEERVYQNRRYRWLTFDSPALQTVIHRTYPERPILSYIPLLITAARAQPADCCLLGLGGAGVAHALRPFLGEARITAVECNPKIIEIAETYFMTQRLSNLTVIEEDAYAFVRQTGHPYQHLLIDLFNAHAFPAHCDTHDFFWHCERLLKPQGMLAINLANTSEQWAVFEKIRAVFKHATAVLPDKRSPNLVILACRHPSAKPLLNLLQTTHPTHRLLWDARWGLIAQRNV